MAQTPADFLVQGYRETEVTSVSDAIEQLQGQQSFMSMRTPPRTKFAGPAWTVLMKRDENKNGGAAVQGMLDAIDAAPPGAVYVMSVENGGDYSGIRGLMATAMKAGGLAGADIPTRKPPSALDRHARRHPHRRPTSVAGSGRLRESGKLPGMDSVTRASTPTLITTDGSTIPPMAP